MSDQPDRNEKNSAADQDGEAASWNPATEPPPQSTVATIPPPPQKRGSSKLAWLALLLIIGLGAAAAWSLREALKREEVLNGRLVVLESVESDQRSELAALEKKMQGQIREQTQSVLAQASSAAAGQSARLDRIEASLKRVDAALATQREAIAGIGATDRNDWLLAEAEYLIRLANQRLIMSGDVVAAIALLRSADNILLDLGDAALHGARAALAADLAALRALPRVDVEGLYLRLAGLLAQVDQLAIFDLPDAPAPKESPAADDWQGRLSQGIEIALQRMSQYISIKRRDIPQEVLLNPQWEGLLRQNLRMLLEQAQVALLSGNQKLFRESLRRTGHWVEQFFVADETASRAVAAELLALSEQIIAVDIPDVANSIAQLDEAMARRLQLESGD